MNTFETIEIQAI